MCRLYRVFKHVLYQNHIEQKKIKKISFASNRTVEVNFCLWVRKYGKTEQIMRRRPFFVSKNLTFRAEAFAHSTKLLLIQCKVNSYIKVIKSKFQFWVTAPISLVRVHKSSQALLFRVHIFFSSGEKLAYSFMILYSISILDAACSVIVALLAMGCSLIAFHSF